MNLKASTQPNPLARGGPQDPVQCPLCGQPNRCAMEVEKETGRKQPPCWCTGVTFEPSTLALIPPASRGLACICGACATQASHKTLFNI